jgi:serine/threonine protein kinase
MVYEWLCGEPPFCGSEVAVCVQHVSIAPLRLREHVPSISPAVERVVLKALEKDPRQRFAHVLEFASALKHASLEQRR